MRQLLLGGALAALLGSSALAGILGIEVFDGATLIGSIAGVTTGSTSLSTTDPNFSSITVDAEGVPILPAGDLSTVTLDASASVGFTGSHVLTVDIFQTGLSVPAGGTLSTFTANSLVGTPGPTTETTYEGGSSTTLGTALATTTFAAGVTNGSVGPLGMAAPAFDADAQSYAISFDEANQSFGGTIEFKTAVPEVSTLAMVIVGFGLLTGFLARRRPSSPHRWA
jgi:hypothetical protein